MDFLQDTRRVCRMGLFPPRRLSGLGVGYGGGHSVTMFPHMG